MNGAGVVLQGAVRVREGKKWADRWCVVRRASPAADSVQLEVYSSREKAVREGPEGDGARCVRGVRVAGCGAERLHGEAHTVWALGGGRGALLAVGSGERARGWRDALRGAREVGQQDDVWPVRVGGVAGSLLRAGGQLALLTDTPPRLLASWSLTHIRRYGVVGGKFCLEAGVRSGEHAGLHVLESRVAGDICRALDRQTRGQRGGVLSRSHTAPLEVGFHPAWTMQEVHGVRGRARERSGGERTDQNYDVPPAPAPLAARGTSTDKPRPRDPSSSRPGLHYENMSYSHDDYLPMWPLSPLSPPSDYTSMTPGRTARRRSPASCDSGVSGVSSGSFSPPRPPRRHRPRSCCEYRPRRTVDSPA